MPYQSLARKYRPTVFSDLVGQDGVAKALANGIKLGREPHAVIFSGVRGIGKTTTARLYAKALNCEHGPTPEPCGVCESCRAIETSNHEDVLEIDGASNTGVDDVRALQETISYVPRRSKFKIYIIDEVHMLSQSAFNALLKTLEEPPPRVVFVFATTELQKIPKTIVSRCQTFGLQRFSIAAIKERLNLILEQEQIKFDPAVVKLIAKEGHGSMRDALTCLDQVIAVGGGEVSLEAFESVVVYVSSASVLELIEAAINKIPERIFSLIDEIDQKALEYKTLVEEICLMCRNAFVIKELGAEHLDVRNLDLDESDIGFLQQISTSASTLDLNRLFRTMNQCLRDLDGSSLDRFVVENYLIEWCLDPGLPMLDSQTQSAAASRSLNVKTETQARSPRKNFLNEIKQRSQPGESRVVEALVGATKPQFPATWKELVNQWKEKKPLQARVLEEAFLISYDSSLIKLAVEPGSMAGAKLLQPQIQQKIQSSFAELFSFNGKIEIQEKAAVEETAKLEENLATQREREKKQKHDQLVKQYSEEPLTRQAMQMFDARVDEVIIDS